MRRWTATNAVPVDSSNVEQLRAWDGGEGEYWAENAEYFDRSVAAYHEPLFTTAEIGELTRCSMSGAVPARPPVMPPALRPLAPPSASTCRHACWTMPAAAPPRRV